MGKLLSIIIPTKNRQKYCLAAVKQILSLRNEDIEICIQDNSDNNQLQEQIGQLHRSDVVYNYHPGVLSFVDNFSEAVSLASGEYLCMIGDDDGILPNIVTECQYMKCKDLDAYIPSLNAIYYWPSTNPIDEKQRNGYLILNGARIKKEQVDPLKVLNDLLRKGSLNYYTFDLPRLYHGIVKRDVLEKIKQQAGNYFKGLTPDIYMAVALSFVCKRVVKSDTPITISGICPTSGSADSATGRHTGELKNAPHFRGHDNYVWDSLIPAFYSVETIWAETLVKAIKHFNRGALLDNLNLPLLYLVCVNKYPQFNAIITEAAIKNNIQIARPEQENKFFKKAKEFIGHVRHRLLYGKSYHFTDVYDIEKACKLTTKNI